MKFNIIIHTRENRFINSFMKKLCYTHCMKKKKNYKSYVTSNFKKRINHLVIFKRPKQIVL